MDGGNSGGAFPVRKITAATTAALAVRGAGGKSGGASGGSGAEAPNTLRSIEYARVLDLLCEGEIGGLVAGFQSIDINDTPLQNADGSYNFAGVFVSGVTGTQAQDYLPGFGAQENEVAVNAEVKAAVPVIRSVSNANVNAVRVTVSVPRLAFQLTTNGALIANAAQLLYYIQSNGGGYVQQVPADGGLITGKTTTRYQRSYRFELTGSGPWDIKVARFTADATTVNDSKQTFFDSYTEIIDTKLAYPNSALVGVQIDASQFNAVPKRSYDIKGLKIRVPANYEPTTRVYTGVWDGTFTTEWSDNPAWCFYDLLVNTRYGLGNYVAAAQIDKWALYAIAQYCDELVDDGFGDSEPRFTCNLYLQTRAEAFKVIANLASIFRGMTYWAAGAITAVADMPSDAIALYTMANVAGGKFSYSGSAKNTRHTVALVTWNDPDDNYRQAVEYVEDATGIARYGVVETSIVAFGCTSRGQAHRMGKWLLYSERLETETCTFRCGLDGVLVYPGAVINTQDAARAGKRFGGRVAAATASAVTLDNAVTLSGGVDYTLMCMAPDGSLMQSAVTTGAGAASVLNVAPAFDQAPQVNAVWVLAASNLAPEIWRVLAATEVDKTTFEIVALAHDPDKFNAVELDIAFEAPPTTSITLTPEGVTNISVTESLYEAAPGVAGNRVLLSWSGTTGRYVIAYKGDGGNWVNLPDSISQTIDIDGLAPDIYTFNVQQVNGIGRRSPVNSLRTGVYGKTAPPADVAGFSVIKSTGFALAQWTLSSDLDVSLGGDVVIRHSPLTTGADWNHGTILETFPGGLTQGLCALITGTYMAKFRDSSGNYSTTAATFVLTEGMITGFTTVGTITEAAGFTGAKTNLAVAASTLSLASGVNWDAVAGNVDSVTGDWDAVGGQSLTGSYAFSAALDLATVATRRFEADVAALAVDNVNTWDSHVDDVDDVDGMFDGAVINDCNVTLYASITNDDPAGSPTWGDWAPFMVSDFTCRAAKFRLDFVAGMANHNIGVTTLTVHAKTP